MDSSYLTLTSGIALIGIGPAVDAADRPVVLFAYAVVLKTIAGHTQARACCGRICTATLVAYWWISVAWAFTLA